ncbi:MAG: class IV adenylate cyclase [Ferruginibacter sp.]
MSILNIEFKAQSNCIEEQEALLLTLHPLFIGEDHQIDTYYHVPNGRLKLRSGNIENSLIHYNRNNIAGSKSSHVLLYQHEPNPQLNAILTEALGVKTIVDKKRKIYFIDNVKFHFDTVNELGTFVEVEAIDKNGTIGKQKLQDQCNYFADFLGIQSKDYIALSYSDLLLAQNNKTL